METDEYIKKIFVIQETWNGQHSTMQAWSNRQLVWRWVEENGMCLLSRKGKPSKAVRTYATLCREWEKNPILEVMIIGTENETRYYNLVKLPVQTK